MDLSVRPAQQRRSKEAWTRVLDAGVAVLTEKGSEGFTIAAVCERAGVTPPTIYRRAPNKDALFLAVYEHGIAQVRATENSKLAEASPPPDGDAAAVVRYSARTIAETFFAHRDFLRAVIIISATNETVRDRGVDASIVLAATFNRLTESVTTPDLEASRTTFFQMLFGALVLRTGFGGDFAMPTPVSEDAFVAGLEDVAERLWISSR
jgi:AcrR family transcriptional regulator